jgi:hypothetical protein
MNLRYDERPEVSGVLKSIYVDQTTAAIPWDEIKTGMLCVIGWGDTTGTYLVKELGDTNLTLTEIYFKRGAVEISKERLNSLRPLAFLEIPKPRLTKATHVGDVFQIYDSGMVVKVIAGRRWLSIVDQLPIVLPVVPRVITRKATQPTTEGNADE